MRLKIECRLKRALLRPLRIRNIKRKRGLLWIMDSYREPAFSLRILTLIIIIIIYRLLLETHDPHKLVTVLSFGFGAPLFCFFFCFRFWILVSISAKRDLFLVFFLLLSLLVSYSSFNLTLMTIVTTIHHFLHDFILCFTIYFYLTFLGCIFFVYTRLGR